MARKPNNPNLKNLTITSVDKTLVSKINKISSFNTNGVSRNSFLRTQLLHIVELYGSTHTPQLSERIKDIRVGSKIKVNLTVAGLDTEEIRLFKNETVTVSMVGSMFGGVFKLKELDEAPTNRYGFKWFIKISHVVEVIEF